jgi:hypothetical protein
VEVQTNADGNHYIELDRPQDEKTVLTYMPHREWAQQAVVRIEVEMPSGKRPWGPEIPVDRLGDFVSGIINLINSEVQDKE